MGSGALSFTLQSPPPPTLLLRSGNANPSSLLPFHAAIAHNPALPFSIIDGRQTRKSLLERTMNIQGSKKKKKKTSHTHVHL